MFKNILFSILLGFILSLAYALILLPKLKYRKQSLSIYLEEKHNSKKNTPTMGGLIFVISSITGIFILYLLKLISINYSLIIVLFTFLFYSIIGLIDDYLIVKKHNNKGLSEDTKLVLQIILSVIFFYLFMIADNEPLLWIHMFNLKIDIGFIYGLFILFILVASSNAVNLTDGLDGLATSLCIICFITYGIISYSSGWLDGYKELSLFSFLIVGSLLGFLIFNINPAKIFMGDTGSLALGGLLGSYAILTRTEFLLILIAFVFVVETVTCIIQRIYYKFTKKRFFKMTPIHHSFEKSGYKEVDIVRLFVCVGLIFNIISLLIYNFI